MHLPPDSHILLAVGLAGEIAHDLPDTQYEVIAVIAFYCSNTGASIFVLLLAAALLNTALFNHGKMTERFDAIAEGWNAGKRARPLFGIDWTTQWHRPIEELREELRLPSTVAAGVGILADAA